MYVFFFVLFYFFALCNYIYCVLCFFSFVVATWREAPHGVVGSRHSSLCYCFWALIIVLLFLGTFLIAMLLLGTFHHALTRACTRQNYYLTFQNKLVFFSNSINIFFPFLFCFSCVCVYSFFCSGLLKQVELK